MAEKTWCFADPEGVSFDSKEVELVGGCARLKCLVPDLLFYARYDESIDANHANGSITGRARSGASILGAGGRFGGGCLDLTGEVEGRTVTYNAARNADNRQTGCVSFWIKPNYCGVPPTFKHMFSISADLDVHNHANYLSMHHGSSNGAIGAIIRDETGAEPVDLDGGPWEPSAGTWYHVELDWDIERGETRLFLDGKQRAETVTVKAKRSDKITVLNVGKELPDTFAPDFYMQGFHVYASPQHDREFTPPKTPTIVYAPGEAMLTTEAFSVSQFHSFRACRQPDTGEVRYILRAAGAYRFYDGSEWRKSDGTYSQASNAEQMARGMINYAVGGSVELVILLHSDDGSGAPRLESVTVEYQ